jgi:hypothetical protein
MNSRQKRNIFFLAVLFLSILLLAFFIDPKEVSLASCRFKRITGYNCPTCGLSRSFYATAHIHLNEAFAYHLLGPVLYIAFILFIIKSIFEIATDKKIKPALPEVVTKSVIGIFILIWIVFWINNL